MVSEKDFSGIGEGDIVLTLSSGEDILEENTKILKILTKELNFNSGLYITVSRPYDYLKTTLEKNKVDVSRLYFIDCISKSVGVKAQSTPQCKYIESPTSLSELGVSITEAVGAMPESSKFLFMDMLSTLLIYNSAGSMAKFSRFLMEEIRMTNISAVFTSVESEMDYAVVGEITQFCNRIIHL